METDCTGVMVKTGYKEAILARELSILTVLIFIKIHTLQFYKSLFCLLRAMLLPCTCNPAWSDPNNNCKY